MSLLDMARRRKTSRVNRRPRPVSRTPWAGPGLPITWMDDTVVPPEGRSTFGDNRTDNTWSQR